MLQKESTIHSKKQATRVRVPWKKGATSYMWTEITVFAIDNFGLPGERYYTKVTEDFMDFYFYDNKDAVHFELRWG